MSNKQQTAVEWYENQLHKVFNNTTDASNLSHEELLKQAKEMEKEQIKDAWVHGDQSDCLSDQDSSDFAEQYYNETYGGNK